MDPIFDRLGRLFRSTFETDEEETTSSSGRNGDSDYNDAMDELDEFLNSGKAAEEEARMKREQQRSKTTAETKRGPLAAQYAILGLTPSASLEEVAKAYKKLMIANHPDRHSTDPASAKKATETSQKINEAYQKIKSFYEKK